MKENKNKQVQKWEKRTKNPNYKPTNLSSNYQKFQKKRKEYISKSKIDFFDPLTIYSNDELDAFDQQNGILPSLGAPLQFGVKQTVEKEEIGDNEETILTKEVKTVSPDHELYYEEEIKKLEDAYNSSKKKTH